MSAHRHGGDGFPPWCVIQCLKLGVEFIQPLLPGASLAASLSTGFLVSYRLTPCNIHFITKTSFNLILRRPALSFWWLGRGHLCQLECYFVPHSEGSIAFSQHCQDLWWLQIPFEIAMDLCLPKQSWCVEVAPSGQTLISVLYSVSLICLLEIAYQIYVLSCAGGGERLLSRPLWWSCTPSPTCWRNKGRIVFNLALWKLLAITFTMWVSSPKLKAMITLSLPQYRWHWEGYTTVILGW